ncbi:MAG: molybdopterin-dependent oxidoreductase [Bacillota bacterium]
MKKITVILTCLVFCLLALTGCGGDEVDLSVNDDAKLLIHGLSSEDFEISLAELKEYESVTESATASRYNGEEVKVKLTGTLLSTLLEDYGYKQTDFKAIRFYGSDGYSIALGSDILANDEIIIGYYDDGKPIDSENGPFRSIVVGERAMYWVRMLNQIDFETGEGAEEANKVIFLDEAAKAIGTSAYNGTSDQAVTAKALVDEYAAADGVEKVYLLATDGLSKDELASNFLSAYIKTTGENSPMFTAPDLPEGMHVNGLIAAHYGKTAFFSLKAALETGDLTGYDQYDGVAFSSILKKIGSMGADAYKITDINGNSVTYEFTQLGSSLFFLDEKGEVVFVPGVGEDQPVTGVISIEPVI